MPSIPHSYIAAILAFAAPLAAFAIAVAVPLVARRGPWVAQAGPVALFAGWALLQPLSLLPRVVWSPHRGTETLLAPALACVVGVAVVAWRGGRQARLVAVAMAAFAGWWMARAGVGPADFWRVWCAIGVLAWVLSKVIQDRADRVLVLSVALWGGLAVAGSGQGWLRAALVAAACAAGLLASGAAAAVPAASIAALIGAADLAGGRLQRGRLDTTDFACIAAVAAPLLTDMISNRLRRLPRQLSAVLSRVIAAAAAVAAVWVLRRAIFT